MRHTRFVVVVLFSVVALLLLASGGSHGFALLGPNADENGAHGANNPNVGFFQPFAAGFRWSISGLTFSISPAFSAAFGIAGANAVRNAFATWDAAFGTNGPAATQFISPVPGNLFDLESIALHEIGHALGFHHPDQAGALNFDPVGNARVPTGQEVMHSTIGPDEVQRALTRDDTDGLNYLYAPGTVFPTILGGNTGAGPGDLNFAEVAAGVAAAGGTVGANFDILVADLGVGGPLGVTSIFGGAPSGAGDAGIPAGYLSGGVRVGGTFNGIPLNLHGLGLDNANHGNTLISIDITFNSNNNIGGNGGFLGVNPVPEPSTLALFSLGLAGLALRRRRARVAVG